MYDNAVFFGKESSPCKSRDSRPGPSRNPEKVGRSVGFACRAYAREWRYNTSWRLDWAEIARKQKNRHARIAAASGTSRTRVTAILNGNLDHVWMDLLIRMLVSLGYRVRVSVVKPAASALMRPPPL